jgi:hypothetical protein
MNTALFVVQGVMVVALIAVGVRFSGMAIGCRSEPRLKGLAALRSRKRGH